MADPLETLLKLRRRAEDEAAAAQAFAAGERATAEAEQGRQDQAAAAARKRLLAEGTRGARPVRAAEAADGARYLARLRDEAERLARLAGDHRRKELVPRLAAEAAARQAHRAAQAERESLDKHRARAEAETRRVAERRAEATQDDVAASRHGRH